MKSTEFVLSNRKVFGTSLSLIICLLGQIGLNIFFAVRWTSTSHISAIILLNIIFCSLNIPGIIMFLNYYSYSRDLKLILTYEELQLMKNNKLICSMKNGDIMTVESIEGLRGKQPWDDFGYVKFTDKNGKEIIVTNFILKLHELWLNTLSRKISNRKIIFTKKFFPYIKENSA